MNCYYSSVIFVFQGTLTADVVAQQVQFYNKPVKTVELQMFAICGTFVLEVSSYTNPRWLVVYACSPNEAEKCKFGLKNINQ